MATLTNSLILMESWSWYRNVNSLGYSCRIIQQALLPQSCRTRREVEEAIATWLVHSPRALRRVTTSSTGVASPAIAWKAWHHYGQSKSSASLGPSWKMHHYVRQSYAQCHTRGGGTLRPDRKQPSQLSFTPRSHLGQRGRRSSLTKVMRRSTPVDTSESGASGTGLAPGGVSSSSVAAL